MTNITRAVVELPADPGSNYQLEATIDYELIKSDYDNSCFTGILSSPSRTFSGNIRSSRLINLLCENFLWVKADILDCQVEDTVFRLGKFQASHFAGCIVRRTVFEDCYISDINFSNNHFLDVNFINCKFDTFIFKTSRFISCTFQGCITGNHTFDTCLFEECNFKDFLLLPSTILLNTGLRRQQFDQPKFSLNRLDENEQFCSEKIFQEKLIERAQGLQERFSIYLYTEENIENLVLKLIELFDTMILVSKAISSGFLDKLTILSGTLNYLFDSGIAPPYLLSQFQEYIIKLMEVINRNDSDNDIVASFLSRLSGLRIDIANTLSPSLMYIEELSQEYNQTDQIILLVDGKYDKSIYEDLFSPSGASIKAFKPHNSPYELVISIPENSTLLWIIAAFVTTRIKYYYEEKPKDSFSKNTFSSTDIATVSKKVSKREFQLGRLQEENLDFSLVLSSTYTISCPTGLTK